MTTALVPIAQTAIALNEDPASRLFSAWIASQTANTRQAYAKDIASFAAYLGAPSAAAAMRRLVSTDPGDGNGLLLDYRTYMSGEGLSTATINRRLSAIRSAVKLARTLGHTNWKPEIAGLKAQSFRDTRGPGLEGTRELISIALTDGNRAVAARDAAFIRLMFDLALRRGECVGLDIEDIDLAGRRIWILGKGRTQKEARTLPDKTAAALTAWIEARRVHVSDEQRAVFVSLSGRGGGQRITGRSVHRIIASIGDLAGIKTRPHGLRHASITAALDINNGDVRAAQQHARHANPQTTMKYDDNRRDIAGSVAHGISALV
ncbi:MAG: site-specific integrase [Xanthobacteraceae bacterium]|nr:site-specific integrase [Xanthobacteraceae bacterium]